MSQRIAAAHERYALNGYAHGSENFIEAAFVSLCRHAALWKFDQFWQEATERLHALAASNAVQEALRLPNTTAAALHFDFGKGPDRNTALSNENWHIQIDEAFSHLMDCGNALQLQLAVLMEDVSERMALPVAAAAAACPLS